MLELRTVCPSGGKEENVSRTAQRLHAIGEFDSVAEELAVCRALVGAPATVLRAAARMSSKNGGVHTIIPGDDYLPYAYMRGPAAGRPAQGMARHVDEFEADRSQTG